MSAKGREYILKQIYRRSGKILEIREHERVIIPPEVKDETLKEVARLEARYWLYCGQYELMGFNSMDEVDKFLWGLEQFLTIVK